jgi:hypothetical protein
MQARRIIEVRDRIALAAYAAMRRVEADAEQWAAEGPASTSLQVERLSDADRELFEAAGLLPTPGTALAEPTFAGRAGAGERV